MSIKSLTGVKSMKEITSRKIVDGVIHIIINNAVNVKCTLTEWNLNGLNAKILMK